MEEIKREIKKFLDSNENEDMTFQNLWDRAKAVLGEIYNHEQPHQKIREISNK
jgi:hypothetical protein